MCRGRFLICSARSITGSGMSSTSGESASPFHRLICLLQASCCPWENPSARAMSRTALRPR